MPKKLDLTGKKFGRLTVVEEVKKRYQTNGTVFWKCICTCGNIIETNSNALRSNLTQSCGCLNKEIIKESIKDNLGQVENTNLSYIKSDKLSKANKSGVKGVCFIKSRNKWQGRIDFKKHTIHLGYFDKLEDAIKARKEAEEKYFQPILEKYDRL